MIYLVRAYGVKVVSTKFERMGVAAINAKPAMETIATLMMEIFDKTFSSEGRRGGGSWRADTIEWLTRKEELGLDERIGHATLALRDSLSVRGAAHQELEVTHNRVSLGSSLPYADTQQRHRPFMKFTERDRLAMRAVIRDYLMAAWRAG